VTSAEQVPGSWTPGRATIDDANLTRFLSWLVDTGRGEFADYHELWAASVDDLEWFWDAIWKFFDIQAATAPPAVLAGSECLASNGFRARR